MKNILFILAFILLSPTIFSQNDINGTAWEVSYRDKSPNWIYLVGYLTSAEDSNRYLIMTKDGYIFPTTNESRTWTLKDKKVVFKSENRTLSGTINDEGNYISGVAMNKDGDVWDWWAKRIDFDYEK